MTPAERDEVRRRASDRLADHSMATVTSDERCACDRCDDDRAVLRYVPPGDAADSSIVPYAADLRALVESQRRDYLDVCDAIAPETSGPADAAAKVRALRRHYDAAGPDHNLLALLDLYHEREQAALAKLAEAKRLGREACDFFGRIGAEDSYSTHTAVRIAAALGAL